MTSTHTSNGSVSDSSIVKSNLKGSLKSHLIMVISSVIALSVLRNIATWVLRLSLGTSGYAWQELWNSFLDVVGEDNYTLWVYGTTIYTTIFIWIIGGIFTIMDITNKPEILRKYKIQPGTNEPVETGQLINVMGKVLFNQIIVGIPAAMVGYEVFKMRGFPPLRQLPSFTSVLGELLFFVIMIEIGVYYTHRLLHYKYFYRLFHKRHHEWTAPIALVAFHSHPFEHVFNNIFPLLLGPAIMGSHLATGWLWISGSIFVTLYFHSGYHFPYLPSPEAHDYHHVKFNQNYGITGLLDHFHDTNFIFRKSREFQRHTLFFGFTPIRETIPDEIKTK